MIELNEAEILGLYTFLKDLDNDEVMQGLVEKLQPFIFARLSLEEIENVNDIYKDDPYCLQKREIT